MKLRNKCKLCKNKATAIINQEFYCYFHAIRRCRENRYERLIVSNNRRKLRKKKNLNKKLKEGAKVL